MTLDFNRPIIENAEKNVLICAHRGFATGNIPCNTSSAFKAALMSGADMIELDVARSREGELFVFHPGMEEPHLHTVLPLKVQPASMIEKRRFVNQDDTKTQFGISRLEDIFMLLKDKCYINVDKFWTDIPGITELIYKCKVEKQVVVKAKINEKNIALIKQYAKELMFLPIVRGEDTVTDWLTAQGINCIGAEVLFESDEEAVASTDYIEAMHKKGKIVFVNSIVYDYKDILAGVHNDDTAISSSPDLGWGWLIDRGYDIIQTDWCPLLKQYRDSRSK